MALADIYLVRMKQHWSVGGKALENVFFYQRTAGAGNWLDLAAALELAILPPVNAIQSAVVVNDFFQIINMGNPADFGDYPIEGAGGISTAALPPHSSISYTMKTNTRAVKKGGKRFAGVPEANVENGKINDTGYLALIETLRVRLSLEIVDDTNTWLPVIIKRVKEPVVGTVPLQYTYRLPINDSELVVGEIVTVLTTDNVGHQVSREV